MLWRRCSIAITAAGDGWIPNIYGGRENLEPSASCAISMRWSASAAPAHRRRRGIDRLARRDGGSARRAGLLLQMNMGWMHDTLRYIEHEPIHRAYHHDDMTFGLLYASPEIHPADLARRSGLRKHSLLGKMPGDRWRASPICAAYLGFMWAHPGKKRCSWAARSRRNANGTTTPRSTGRCSAIPPTPACSAWWRDLNRLYAARTRRCMYATPAPTAFAWLVGDRPRQFGVRLPAHGGRGHRTGACSSCNMTRCRGTLSIGVPECRPLARDRQHRFTFLWRQRSRNDGEVHTLDQTRARQPLAWC